MSKRATAWCKKRGEVRGCLAPPASKKILKHREDWEERCGEGVWAMRPIWLQKPRACFESPFKESLWIDLDCEIRGPLDPLFEALSDADLAVARDAVQRESFVVYNSGVIAFRKCAIIDRWIDQIQSQPDEFLSDQDYLSRAIALHRPKCVELPSIYNWSCMRGESGEAAIVHYLGAKGKVEILNRIASDQFLKSLNQ